MTTLPQWANTRIGRACIAEIIANPPEQRVTSGESYNYGGRIEYRSAECRAVATLKRLHREWKEREIARLDQRFERTGHWDQEAATAVCRAEDAHALIGRLLGEADQERSEAA